MCLFLFDLPVSKKEVIKLSILLSIILGLIIGYTASKNGVGEPYYIQIYGMVWAIIISVPIFIVEIILI